MAEKTEEFKVSGNDILKKIKELINEGNIRRITIKNKEGKQIAEFPLTFGMVGTVLAPVLAAIGTIVALASECTISVIKEVPENESEKTETDTSEENVDEDEVEDD